MINNQIIYVVTGVNTYSDDNETSVLYAGVTEEVANVAVQQAHGDLEDFYKEIWIGGEKVRTYYRPYKSASWSLAEGDTKDLVKEVDEHITKLGASLAKLKRVDAVSNILPREEKEDFEESVRNIFGQVHSMYNALEDIRVPK